MQIFHYQLRYLLRYVHNKIDMSRVRKSIHALSPLERKSYFWCLKMLSILPPPPAFKYTFTTIAGQTIEAKCLHDLLIAGHNTGCQHHSIYFSHYHRHLCALTELWLNYAHTILRRGEADLKQKYPVDKYPLIYHETSDLWTMIFQEYKVIQFDTVSLHYWNPSNYKEKLDLVVPPELSVQRIASPDAVDKLLKKVRNHYPWEINIKTRMTEEGDTSTPEQLRRVLLSPRYKDQRYLLDEPIIDDKKTSLLIQGKFNPREPGAENPGQNLRSVTSVLKKFINLINRRVASRNMVLFNQKVETGSSKITQNEQVSENIYIVGLSEDQMQTTYFSQAKKLHYISKQEGKALFGEKYPRHIINEYNNMISHYNLALSLFDNWNIKTFYDFIYGPYNIQRSHNIMHNNYGYFFRDAQNSPTNLLFYLYHSWIDFQIEAKIRMLNGEDKTKKKVSGKNQYQTFLDNLTNKNNVHSTPEQVRNSPQSINMKVNVNNEKVANYLKTELADFAISPFFKEKKDQFKDMTKIGAYYIIQWIDPNYTKLLYSGSSKDIPKDKHIITVAGQARDYMLDPKNKQIRTSKNISEVYTQIYLKNYKSKYSNLGKGIKGDNFIESVVFDYDYEVWDQQKFKQNKLELLRDDGLNLPQYLLDMKKEFTEPIKLRQQNLALNLRLMSPVMSQESSMPFHKEAFDIENEASIFADRLSTFESDFFRKFITFTIDYPSSTKNGLYPVRLKVSKHLKHHFKNLSADVIEQLDRIAEEGIEIYNVSVFGKEENAETCIHCLDKKRDKVELDSSLYNSSVILWKYLHLYSLNNGVVALKNYKEEEITEKQGHQHDHCCVSNQLEVESILDFDIKWLLGAEETSLKFELKNKTERRPIGTIRVQAHSYSNYTGELKTISRKTTNKLDDTFDFYELHDLSSGSQTSFDNFSYRKVRGSIIINSIEETFEFDIHNFQKKINYVVYLVLQKDKIEIQVRDQDYEFKKAYYETFKE